jgi:hypothetical protein
VSRCLAASLIESFDHMDPTRSHEMLPSERLRIHFRDRRFMRRLYASVLTTAAVIVLIVAIAH